MQLLKINIANYKNIEQAELSFSPNVNCFIGANGMGKTNLLDAIYYLSFCKSSGSSSDAFNIRHDADYFMIEGQYVRSDGERDEVLCSAKAGSRKRVRRNGKDVKRFVEHVGSIPLVFISPSDSLLISGGSEERRRYMDAVISQYNPSYMEALIRYDKALKQRNALLKLEQEPDWSYVDVMEDLMSADASLIYAGRRAFVEDIVPLVKDLYEKLSNKPDEVMDVQYLTHGDRGNLKQLLSDGRQKERIVGYTLHGPHKDDLLLTLNGFPVKREGSQGQSKTLFISLKLAQYQHLRMKGSQQTPLLLLDDIFDKLDADRVARIIDYAAGDALGQIFITDTNRGHLDHILAATQKPYKLFHVKDGVISDEA